MKSISAPALRALIVSDEEVAVVDAREEGTYSESHILYASSLPLSRLEVMVDALIPRRTTPVVVCDAGEGVALRAARRLLELGYTDVAVLDGGNEAWAAAGYVLFSGVNVPSKAFGEVVEHEFGTPSLSAEELKAKVDAGEDLVILDSRPMPEYHAMNIPGGTCCPGVELPYRVHDAAPSPDTTVVVNCAGRTRSIIGAQLLINAGIPNPVVALRNGTMGWTLAGFELENGRTDHVPAPSDAGLERARAAAARVAERFGVRSIDRETLAAWRSESADRSLYVFDVRTPEEYEAGHLEGARWIAGGQLVQATDQQVATLRARVVLVDDDGVRATMAASWLVQMGWRDAVVLEGGLDGLPLESGPYQRRVLGIENAMADTVDADTLAGWIADDAATVLDLSLNKVYRAGHVPGARYAVRARLEATLERIGAAERLVFTSEDGAVARFAAHEAAAMVDVPVHALEGGNAGWVNAGHALTADDPVHDDLADDAWLRPFERGRSVEDAMRDYLTWEIALVGQIEQDATAEWLRHPPEDALMEHYPEIRDAVARLCERFPGEYWRECDRERAYPSEFVQALTDGGYLSILVPEEYGGSGLPISAAAAVLEEIHRAGCNGGACHAQMYTMGTVLRHGSEDQKNRYLPGIASGDLRLQAFGVTEPTSGTNTLALRTTAVKQGNSTYKVNGQKVWTSRAEYSDLMLLLARTTPVDQVKKRTDGLSVFLVDMREARGKGLEIRPIRTMVNHSTTEVFFDDLEIPADSLVGEEGKGFRYILDGMNAERILIASECIGDARWFIKKATDYANDRRVFDRPIGQNQGIQFPIAQAYAASEAAALMCEKAADRFEAGEPCGEQANMAKLLASEASWQAADMCMQTHGGYAFAEEYDVERKFREARLYRIAPISNNFVLSYLAEHVLGLPRSY